MMQFFIVFLNILSLISLKLIVSKLNEGILRDQIISYDFLSYMFRYYKHKHAKWYECLAIFSSFRKFLSFFEIFPASGAKDHLLWGLLLEHCIVYSNNGLVFNNLMSRTFAFFE